MQGNQKPLVLNVGWWHLEVFPESTSICTSGHTEQISHPVQMTSIKPKADVPVALPPHKASDSKDPHPLSKDSSQKADLLNFQKTVSSLFCQALVRSFSNFCPFFYILKKAQSVF